jgi:hypothetical protein
LQLHGQVQRDSSAAPSLANDAATVLAQRAAALQALIQENPRAALSFAFSPELLADLAAKFPQSAATLESHVTLSGSVEHWIADSADIKSSKESWFLNVAGTRLSLYFATPQRPYPPASTTVTVEGVQLGSQVSVSKFSSSALPASSVIPSGVFGNFSYSLLTLLLLGFLLAPAPKLAARTVHSVIAGLPAAAGVLRQIAVCAVALLVVLWNPLRASAQSACSTTGVQNYLIVLVNLPGLPLPSTVTPAALNTLFFGPAPSVANYVDEVSYGKASVTGTIVGPYALTGTYSCSNWFSAIAEDAIAAAVNAGTNMNNYSRVFVVASDLSPSCGFAALSTVGCQNTTTSAGTFYVSYTTAFPDYLFTYHGVYVAAHDGVGHQLGLAHSKLRQYTDSTGTAIPLGALSDSGTITEYGDHYAVMGTYNQGHFAAAHKANWLNWMSAGADYETVTTSGTYTIQPIESASGLRALKVQRGTGNPGYFLWIEFPQSLGNYDSTYATLGPYVTQVYQGAYVHYEDSTTGEATHLLDFSAPAAYNENPALVAGQTWTDPYTDLSISVVSATPAGLTVNVTYSGASSCISSAPSVSVSPLNPSIYPGQTASYSASVTNNDSSGCSSSTINLGSSAPSGWSTSLSSSAATLSPGQSASVTLSKGAPSGTPAGTYAVNLNASTSASTGSAVANATVMAPPTLAVSVATSATTILPPSTVSITASVSSGGMSASGANVTFTLTGPNGSSTTQNATTSTSGTATWSYKVNSRSLVGTYSVVAQASLGSGSTGKKTASAATQAVISNTAAFSVQ